MEKVNATSAPAPQSVGAVPSTRPRKIRGTMTVSEDDSMEFRPQQAGEPQQELIRKSGQSKLYRTTGKKEQKLIAHLVCDADAPDAFSELSRQLEQCAAVLETREPRKPVGAVLLHKEDVDVRFNRTKRIMQVAFSIDLNVYPNYQKRFMNLMQEINQCFAINPTFSRQPKR